MNEPLLPALQAPCHAVHFYRDHRALSDVVSGFLADGFTCGQPAIVVARPQLRQDVEATLQTLGIDVTESLGSGRLVLLDAGTVLNAILANGRPDPARFRREIGSVFAGMPDDGGPRTVRIYGEMVDLLWQAGERVAALELEDCWNTLASSYDFSLLCAYATSGKWERSAEDDIRTFHSHALYGPREFATIG